MNWRCEVKYMAEAEIREVHVERYYPSVLANAREFAAIAEAENPELRALWQVAWKWYLNTFVYDFDIAGAARWEQMLSLRPKSGESLDTRRRRILAKINAVLPYTFRRLEEMLDALCGVGSYDLAVDYVKRELYFNTDPDVAGGLNQVSKLLRAVVPANLALYIVMLIMQEWAIKHAANVMQFSNAKHCVWNQGTAQTTRWDSTYRFDRQIRWNGIYGADYREQQHHVVEIWYMVEAVQYNLVPVNVWDGSFTFDASHRWGGSSMQRLPLHESRGCGLVLLQQARAAKLDNRIAAMNCPDVYLANPSDHASTNLQAVHSPQVIKPRQISESLIASTAPHRQQWSFSAAPMQHVDSPHRIGIDQSDSSTQRAAARQVASLDHVSVETGQTAAHHAQTIKQPTSQIGNETARGKTKINIDVVATERAAATLTTDYRTSNLFDGSFCFDGTHTFGGASMQNYARATHCCSITRITKNGLGRMETT